MVIELVSFVYANATFVTVITVGAWIGGVFGVVMGCIYPYRYIKREGFYSVRGLSIGRRNMRYVGLVAGVAVFMAAGATIGSVTGVMVFLAMWMLLLPSLIVGGVWWLVASVRRRHKYAKAKALRANT